MSAVNRATDTFERSIPIVVVAAIALAGYFWFVQPRIGEYLSNRNEVATLESRVRTLQDTVNRGRGVLPPDEAATIRQFEEQVSRDDKVSEIVETLARLALDSAPKGKVRGLRIQTGTSAQWQSGEAPARGGSGLAEAPDPRFALFQLAVTYTPVTVSFESSYEAITRFVWQLRDMPTMIEVRSIDLTRGLPFMRAEVLIYVYQRSGEPAAPAPTGPGSSLVPRIARLSAAEGW